MKMFLRNTSITPGVPTQKGQNASPDVTSSAYPNITLGNYDVPSGWPANVKFNEPGDVPGPVVQFEDDDQGDVKAGYGFESDNLYEGDWFFFHTDHLGSTSYLTDTAGNVSQFVCYTPYGEAIVDEHLTTYENPFKFSGKELDDITGLYDHGARSRNPVSTLWYGIDPLFEKYPDFSPYNYCAGNPVKLVDEDGRSPMSIAVKVAVKSTLKKAAKSQVKRYLQHRLKKYLSSKYSNKWASKFIDKATSAIDIATSESWWEFAAEAIPIAGDAYGAYKLTNSGAKVWLLIEKFERRADAIDNALHDSYKKLRNALGLVSGEAHHIIPVKLLKANEVVQDAVSAGFDFNGAINGVKAVKYHGPHINYTNEIEDKINEWQNMHPNYTPEQAKSFLESMASRYKDIINKNGGRVEN